GNGWPCGENSSPYWWVHLAAHIAGFWMFRQGRGGGEVFAWRSFLLPCRGEGGATRWMRVKRPSRSRETAPLTPALSPGGARRRRNQSGVSTRKEGLGAVSLDGGG